MKPVHTWVPLFGIVLAGGAGAAGLPEITVEAALPDDPSVTVVPLDSGARDMPADAGAWLRTLPGVSGTRLGGHGIDPVIRGQGETRLNVLLDGAYVHGGCPNRMDPPSSYAPLDSYDRVTVIKGAQTVRYGGGGSGGTVLFERDTPRFAPGEGPRAKFDAGYGSNGNSSDLSADLAAGNPTGYLRLVAGRSRAGNYADGNGVSVRSAYNERGANLMAGFTPDAATRVELGLEATRGRDILYAGGMDAPVSDADTVRLKLRREASVGPFDGLRAEFYRARVHHVMDNFSLRTLTAPMKMSVPSDSVTTGGRLSVDLPGHGGALWTVGVDLQDNNREALRYSGATLASLNSVMWPDVTLRQTGLFAELARPLGERNRLSAGLRYDRVDSGAAKAGLDPAGMAMSPNQLYSTYYGTTARDRRDDNLGGFVRLEHDVVPGAMVYASLSRSLRAADATERYMAANGMTPDQRWVGNPGLAPERHTQVELGSALRPGAWRLNGSVYYDRVADFILRDRAHGQPGILQTDGATIYRNVDAALYGAELGAARALAPNWSTTLSLAYVRGQDTGDGRPLAQIPPLAASVALDYRRARWRAGAVVRGAARQNRVDADPATGSGVDPGRTPGWAVLDLYGQATLAPQVKLGWGVDNVFDRTYAQHLNRSNDFDPLQVQINEPGRSLWLRVSATL